MSLEFEDAVALVTSKQQKFPRTLHKGIKKAKYISGYKVVQMDLKKAVNFSGVKEQKKSKQAQRRAAAGRSRDKSQGECSTRGRIFPHDAQNGFSLLLSF